MAGTVKIHSANGVIAENDRGHAVIACGNTKPADGELGYAGGCLFIDLDSAGWFYNAGDHDSANFDAVTLP